MATAEEKDWSAKGSIAASPQNVVSSEHWCCAFSLRNKCGSYSSEVTRGASFSRCPVAAPYPAPISSTCSPSRAPDKTHGSRNRCVTRCHSELEQTKCSKRVLVGMHGISCIVAQPILPQ